MTLGDAYLGLAPFLRASIAGEDLRPQAQAMLARLEAGDRNPNLLMNLSIAAQCLNQPELGLAYQQEALQSQRNYHLPARQQPARLHLLVLVPQGNIQSYTPLECLLEGSDIDLSFHYVLQDDRLDNPEFINRLPEHDLLFVGILDSDTSRPLLHALAHVLQHWPKPVLNSPQYLPYTGRDVASHRLQDIPRLLSPQTLRVTRGQLKRLAAEKCALPELLPHTDFPIILRPLGSQAGTDLQKMESPAAVAQYLSDVDAGNFFMAPFVDYADAQGNYRKIRIALIGGEPFVCHMAVSSNWMIHYLNAGMYTEAWKRQEEARFMKDFPQFVARHKGALEAIAQRLPLEYLVMDCAETPSGDLLLFEIDHGGVVHAMDVEALFPYKNAHIAKAREAFCDLLLRVHAADVFGLELCL